MTQNDQKYGGGGELFFEWEESATMEHNMYLDSPKNKRETDFIGDD